jgi:hypothetical protein
MPLLVGGKSRRRPCPAHDAVGNRLYRDNRVASGRDQFYSYDNLHRLTDMQRGNLTAQNNYTYDANQNVSGLFDESRDAVERQPAVNCIP